MQLPGRNQSDGTAGSPGNPTGRLRIEAENFLLRLSGGGETEACGDLGGTLNVGYIDVGDSLSYDVTAPVSGTYTINFRLANGGPVSSFQVRNPVSRAVLATITVPNTGGWQNYITLSATATLPAGQQTLQLLCTAHNWNLNWLELLPPATGSGGYNGSGAYHIEAEDFISQNGTLLENCQDAGGTYNIGSIDNGDWLDYRINMPVGGSYQLRIRAASANSSNSLQLRTATGTVLATLNVTNTGGYQTFSTFTGSVILPAGVQTVRLQVTGGYMAVNWLELSAPPGAPPLDNYALIVRDNPNNTGGGLVYEAENTFTVEFWVKPSGTHELDGESTNGTAGTSGQKYVMYPTNGGDGYGSRAGMGISVGTNGVSVYEHADNYMPAVLVWQRPVDTAWMHVAVVYTNGRPSLYINGEWKKQGLQSGRQHVYPGTQFPGGFYGSQTNGQVDELRIWSVARTGAQIAANMTGELTGTQTGLQGYWPMNEGAGAMLHDVSGRGRDIDLTGAGYSGASWTNGRYSITTTTGSYRYAFNGKEKDQDIGEDDYDYGMRIYDARLGKFLSVDPLSAEYPWNSTYAFAENDPINYIDLDGLEKAKPAFLKNVRIEIYTSDNLYKQRVEKSDNVNQGGQWHIIVSKDIKSANDKLKGYIGEGKVDNLILSSHGFKGGINVGTTGENGSEHGSISNEMLGLYNQRKNATEEEKSKLSQFASPSTEKDIDALYMIVNKVNDGGSIVVTGCYAGVGEEGTEFGTLLLNTKDATLYLNQDFSSYFPVKNKDTQKGLYSGFVSVAGEEGVLTISTNFKKGWKKFKIDKTENKTTAQDNSNSSQGLNIKPGFKAGEKAIQEVKQPKPRTNKRG